MKHHWMIGLVALSIAAPVMAAEDVGAKPEWFACEQDRDCGRSESVCGEPKGVNLKKYKEYAAYLKTARAETQCAPVAKVANLRELKSVCVAQVCHFNPEPKTGDN